MAARILRSYDIEARGVREPVEGTYLFGVAYDGQPIENIPAGARCEVRQSHESFCETLLYLPDGTVERGVLGQSTDGRFFIGPIQSIETSRFSGYFWLIQPALFLTYALYLALTPIRVPIERAIAFLKNDYNQHRKLLDEYCLNRPR